VAQAALPAIRSRRIARIIFALAVLALGLWIARDFLLSVAWAVIIAVALWPLYDRLVNLMPKRMRTLLGPLLFTMAICLVLIVPLVFAAVRLASEAQNAIEWLARVQENGIPPPSWLARIPVVSGWAVSWWQVHLSDPRAAGDLLGSIEADTVTTPIRKFVPQLLQHVNRRTPKNLVNPVKPLVIPIIVRYCAILVLSPETRHQLRARCSPRKAHERSSIMALSPFIARVGKKQGHDLSLHLRIINQ